MMGPYGRLARRELAAAWDGGGGAAGPAAFFLAATALAAFAIGSEPAVLTVAGAGALVLSFTLAAFLDLERLFQSDLEAGVVDQLALGPVPLEGVALAKILARALAVLAPAALVAPFSGILLGLAPSAALFAGVVAAMAAPGLVAAGATAAALAAARPRGGLLIAVITPPLAAPVVIFAAGALTAGAQGGAVGPPLLLLAAADVFALVVGAFGAAAALRLHLE